MNIRGRDSDDTGAWPSNRWRFKREISSGDLILGLTLAGSVFLWNTNIDKRVAVIEAAQVAQAATDARQDREAREGLRDIKLDLAEIRRILLERASK